MSHVTNVVLHIKNLTDLATACRARGAVLEQDETEYFTQEFGKRKCDHRIVMEGVADQIGVIKDNDVFNLEWAPYGVDRRLASMLGRQGIDLKNEYAAAVNTRKLQQKGFRVQRTVDATGKIHLEAIRNV